MLQVASNSLAAGGRSCLLGTQQQRSELERIAASYASVFVAVVGMLRSFLLFFPSVNLICFYIPQRMQTERFLPNSWVSILWN